MGLYLIALSMNLRLSFKISNEKLARLLIDQAPTIKEEPNLLIKVFGVTFVRHIRWHFFDVRAREQGVPLYELLGGKRREGVNFAYYGFFNVGAKEIRNLGLQYRVTNGSEWERERERRAMDAEGVIRQMEYGIAAFGCKWLKLKGGVLHPEKEVEIQEIIARRFGDEYKFVFDPNSSFTLEQAIALAPRLQNVCVYLEDMVPGWNGMAKLAERTGLKLATNMYAPTPELHEQALIDKPFGITLGGDVHYIGGSDKAVELSRWCVESGMGFGNHSNHSSEISFWHTVAAAAACAVHDIPYDTHMPWTVGRGVSRQPFILENGMFQIPDGRGIGFEPDVPLLGQAADRFKQANKYGHFHSRGDERTTRAVFADWLPADKREPGVGRHMLAQFPQHDGRPVERAVEVARDPRSREIPQQP